MTPDLSSHPDRTAMRRFAAHQDWSAVRNLSRACQTTLPLDMQFMVAEAELRQGEFVLARERLETMLGEARNALDAAAIRQCSIMIGAAHFELGDLAKAEAAFEEARQGATAAEDHLIVARATNNLGMLANVQGRHATALAHYRLAIPAFQRLGRPDGLAGTYHNMAITLRDLGQIEEADRHERRAVAFATEAKNERLIAMARTGRAELSLLRSEPEVAAAGARHAANAYRVLEDPVGEADALRLLGTAESRMGAQEQARTTISRALALADRHGSALIKAETLRARAELFVALGALANAQDDVTAAENLFRVLGARAELADLQQWWSSVAATP